MSFCFAIVLPSLCHRDVSVFVHRVSEFDAVSFRVVDKVIDCRSVVYYRVRIAILSTSSSVFFGVIKLDA